MVRRRHDLTVNINAQSVMIFIDISPPVTQHLPTAVDENDIITDLYRGNYKTKHIILPESKVYKNQQKLKLTIKDIMWN